MRATGFRLVSLVFSGDIWSWRMAEKSDEGSDSDGAVGPFRSAVAAAAPPADDSSVASEAGPAFVEDEHDVGEQDAPEVAAAPEAAAAAAPAFNPFSWNQPRDDPGPAAELPKLVRSRKLISVIDRTLTADLGTPMTVLFRFLRPPVMERIVRCTSRRLAVRGQAPLTLPEFYEWLALLITMGIKRLPSTKHYWNTTSFGDPPLVFVPSFPDVWPCLQRLRHQISLEL